MFQKNLQDANLTVVTAIPAAGATATSKLLDLLCGDPTLSENMLVPERIEYQVQIPALPNNVTAGDPVVVTLVDSADGNAVAAIAQLEPISVPGVAGTGSAALTVNVRPPPTTRRYIGYQIAPAAGSGNNTAASITGALVF